MTFSGENLTFHGLILTSICADERLPDAGTRDGYDALPYKQVLTPPRRKHSTSDTHSPTWSLLPSRLTRLPFSLVCARLCEKPCHFVTALSKSRMTIWNFTTGKETIGMFASIAEVR